MTTSEKIAKYIDENWGTLEGEAIFWKRCHIWDHEEDKLIALLQEIDNDKQ